MDLIDREVLIKQTVEKFYTTNYFKHITDMIDNAQKVDAVPMSVIEDIKAEIQKTIEKGMMDAQYGLETALLIIDEKVKEHET